MASDASAYRPCVGIMVLNREGLVWIGRRHDAPSEPEGPGAWWQMPQGGIDEREDPRQAALRELEEETGIRSVEIIAESPGWYTYDLPERCGPRPGAGAIAGRGRSGSRPAFGARRRRSPSSGPAMRPSSTPGAGRRSSELVGLIVPFKRGVYEELVRDFAPLARPEA